MIKVFPQVFILALLFFGTLYAQEEQESPRKRGFWFFSFIQQPPLPKDEFRERMHSMQRLKIFDYVTAFQMENEIQSYAEQAYVLKTRFKERENLIVRERISLVDELESLIKQQKNGENNNEKILDIYKKLYDNTTKMQELGMEHVLDLQKLSQKLFESYTQKTEASLNKFEKNPQELSDLLIQMYEQTNEFR